VNRGVAIRRVVAAWQERMISDLINEVHARPEAPDAGRVFVHGSCSREVSPSKPTHNKKNVQGMHETGYL
jgi:hypothetical protein